MSFKDGVYDITDFVAGHPGGTSRIMMAAGEGALALLNVESLLCSNTAGLGLSDARAC